MAQEKTAEVYRVMAEFQGIGGFCVIKEYTGIDHPSRADAWEELRIARIDKAVIHAWIEKKQ